MTSQLPVFVNIRARSCDEKLELILFNDVTQRNKYCFRIFNYLNIRPQCVIKIRCRAEK